MASKQVIINRRVTAATDNTDLKIDAAVELTASSLARSSSGFQLGLRIGLDDDGWNFGGGLFYCTKWLAIPYPIVRGLVNLNCKYAVDFLWGTFCIANSHEKRIQVSNYHLPNTKDDLLMQRRENLRSIVSHNRSLSSFPDYISLVQAGKKLWTFPRDFNYLHTSDHLQFFSSQPLPVKAVEYSLRLLPWRPLPKSNSRPEILQQPAIPETFVEAVAAVEPVVQAVIGDLGPLLTACCVLLLFSFNVYAFCACLIRYSSNRKSK